MQLDAVFAPALIDLNLHASTRTDAITALTDLLQARGVLADRAGYLAAVHAREEHTSTAVGFGVAIPHGKTDAALRPAVAVGRGRSIDWGGESVDLVFLLAVPERGAATDHLEILALLAQLLLEEGFRQALLAARTAGDAYALITSRIRALAG